MRISDWSSDVCSSDLACTDLASVAGARGAGSDAPGFVRISEAFALLPEAFSPSYQGIDHRFVLTLFDGPGCSGRSIPVPAREGGRAASYRLPDYDVDTKSHSVAIRSPSGTPAQLLRDRQCVV